MFQTNQPPSSPKCIPTRREFNGEGDLEKKAKSPLPATSRKEGRALSTLIRPAVSAAAPETRNRTVTIVTTLLFMKSPFFRHLQGDKKPLTKANPHPNPKKPMHVFGGYQFPCQSGSPTNETFVIDLSMNISNDVEINRSLSISMPLIR